MITKNSVIYQIVTDRFDNEQGNLFLARASPKYNERFNGYLGGTFKGIEKHADYFKELGITDIMISPVEASSDPFAYHGYHPSFPRVINPHFGSAEDLKRMVSSLKERGVGVVMDYVPTHISWNSDIFREKMASSVGQEWFATKKLLRDPRYSQYMNNLELKLTDGGVKDINEVNTARDYFGYFGLATLPLFNLQNPEVIDWHSERMKWLVDEFGFTDVRVDSGFIQPRKTVRQFRDFVASSDNKVGLFSEYWPFYGAVVGECFGFCDGEWDIGASLMLNSFGECPGNIFPLREHVLSRVSGLSREGYKLIASLSSHDLPRFFGSESQQQIAATLLFTLPPFTPCIYYGDEVPLRQFNNGSDRIARSRDIMAFPVQSQMTSFYRDLINFRRKLDFNSASISHFEVYDTDERSRPQNQLVVYNLNFEKEKKTFHVVLNLERRKKPVALQSLVLDSRVIPEDVISGQKLVRLDDGRFILDSESAYILGNTSNN